MLQAELGVSRSLSRSLSLSLSRSLSLSLPLSAPLLSLLRGSYTKKAQFTELPAATRDLIGNSMVRRCPSCERP